MADIQRKTFYQPTTWQATSVTVYEAEWADLLSQPMMRQLLITRYAEGRALQALPAWKNEFVTLASLKKEARYYQALDRLIATIEKHGPLSPTLLSLENHPHER
ncbi:hypothetical protein EO087_04785 [Dyella sp. M7H15-1]|uniref:hypothetical protein n=1 Tax=Dyella sp. M7H15-1 TaxID=2501295 RepID=UPI001004E23B|nr:hypothetical protein [Dyella sp. M7H15-1]QAU23378.1 hypothetical protein EO087_04785 [Dyella sp. M7H15-1]